MILAGDIGGTKVNLALFREKAGTLDLIDEARFESHQYSGLNEILGQYLTGRRAQLTHACFGVAGPVQDGTCRVTNLDWNVDTGSLRNQLGFESVWLINDLSAMACSVPFLSGTDLETLQAGSTEKNGRITVLGAGTGLGQAFLMPGKSGRYQVLDSEGGHCDFAPRNKIETDFLHYLLREFERVSTERVLSGSGLYRIYQFIKESRFTGEPKWLAREFENGEPGLVVTRNGLEKKSSACEQALEIFVSIYGAVSGNLALQVLATGGVYIGGGIAPNLISLIREGRFMEAFLAKGRFKTFLERVPVKLIMNDKASLVGAAHFALGRKFIH